jgi:hypothetical protein
MLTSTPIPTPTTPDATATSAFVELSIDEPLLAGDTVVRGNGIPEALVVVRDLDDPRIVAASSVNSKGQYEIELTSVLATDQLGGLETGHRIQAESEGLIYQAIVQPRITVRILLPLVSKISLSNPDEDYPDEPPSRP